MRVSLIQDSSNTNVFYIDDLRPSADNNDQNISLKSFISLIDLLYPLIWTCCGTFGSLVNKVLNTIFITIFVYYVNNALYLSKKKGFGSFLIVSISVVYSLIYLLTELVYISIGKAFHQRILGYFDLFLRIEFNSRHLLYIISHFANILFGVVLMLNKKRINFERYSMYKIKVQDTVGPLFRFLFSVSISITVASVNSKVTLFITFIYYLSNILSSMFRRTPKIIYLKLVYVIIILAQILLMFIVNEDFFYDINIEYIPQYVAYVSIFLNIIIIGSMLGSTNKDFNLIVEPKQNYFFEIITPFIVAIGSSVSSFITLDWASFPCIILSTFFTLLDFKRFKKLTPILYCVSLTSLLIQDVLGCFMQTFHFHNRDRLIVFILLGFPSFLINSCYESSNKEYKSLDTLKRIIGLISVFVFVSLTGILYANNNYLFGSLFIFCSALFCLSISERYILIIYKIIIFLSITVKLLVHLLNRSNKITELLIGDVSSNIIKKTYKDFIMLALLLFCNYFYVCPTAFVSYNIEKYVIIPIFFLLTFVPTSNVFSSISITLFLLLLIFPKLKISFLFLEILNSYLSLTMSILSNYDFFLNGLGQNTLLLLLGKEFSTFRVANSVLIVLFLFVFRISLPAIRERVTFPPNFFERILESTMNILLQFKFYVLTLIIFVSLIISSGISVTNSVLVVLLFILHAFKIDNKYLIYIILLVYVAIIYFQYFTEVISVNDSITRFRDNLGPSIQKSYERCVNMLVAISMFLFFRNSDNIEHNVYVMAFGNIARRFLVVFLQAWLVFVALRSKSIYSCISLVFVVLLVLSQKYSRLIRVIFLMILSVVFGVPLLCKIIILDKNSIILDLFLIYSISTEQLTGLFFCLFGFSLYSDYSIFDVSFGNTFLTSFGYEIILPLILFFLVKANEWFSLLQTLLLMYILYLSSNNKRSRKLVGTLLFTSIFHILTIAVISCIQKEYEILNSIDIYIDVYGRNWVYILVSFILEYTLYMLMNSNEYKTIQCKINGEIEDLTNRQIYTGKLIKQNERYIKLLFEKTLDNLSVSFGTLIDTGHIRNGMEFLHGIRRSISVLSTHGMNAHDSHENHQTNDDKSIFNYLHDIYDNIITFVKWLSLTFGRFLMCFCDVNISSKMDTPTAIILSDSIEKIVDSYQENGTLIIPEDQENLYESLPLIFYDTLKLLRDLKPGVLKLQNPFQVLISQVLDFSMQMWPILLSILSLIYSVFEHNMISSLFFFVEITHIFFSLDGYKIHIVLLLILLFYRDLTSLPGLSKFFVCNSKGNFMDLKELFGVCYEGKYFIYEYILFTVAYFSQVEYFIHPKRKIEYKEEDVTIIKKINRRFDRVSYPLLPFKVIILTIDIISFIFGIITYYILSSYDFSSFISSVPVLTSDYFIFILGEFCFMIVNQIVLLKKSPLFSYLLSVAQLLFFVIFFVYYIPRESYVSCFESPYYYICFALAMLSILVKSIYVSIGFELVPPSGPRYKPLITIIRCYLIEYIPFLLLFTTIIEWLSVKTSQTVVQAITINQLKNKLFLQDGLEKFSPKSSNEKSHATGYIIIVLLGCLLLSPLLLLTRSTSNSTPNPSITATIKIGISGITEFYRQSIDSSYMFASKDILDSIKNMGDRSLYLYYLIQNTTQFIQLPNSSSVNWNPSTGSLEYILNTNSFHPYIVWCFSFDKVTTKSNLDLINLVIYGNDFDETTTNSFKEFFGDIINGTISSKEFNFTYKDVPLFYTIPSSGYPKYDDDYTFDMDVIYNNGVWSVKANYKDEIEFLSSTNSTGILLYSQPIPEKLISSILNSFNGYIGMYLLILVTFGQFVKIGIDSIFSNLWVTYMSTPDTLINVILSIEAYRLKNDLKNEYVSTMMLMETMRSTHRVISLTDPEYEV